MRLSRRDLLLGGAGAAIAAGTVGVGAVACSDEAGHGENVIAFDGPRQAGIENSAQAHLNLVGFNLNDDATAKDVHRVLSLWTEDCRRLAAGKAPLGSLEPELARPAQLTVTCGLGPGIFTKAQAEAKKPQWLTPLPAFSKDKLDEAWGQTDVALQICCDDPIVLAHVTRHVIRASESYGAPAWIQKGFSDPVGQRNLFGQVDGTVNPKTERDFNDQVWSGNATAMVVRRIAMNIPEWERVDRAGREQAVGRSLVDGSPLSGGKVTDDVDLEARDSFGLPVIDPHSHVARAKSSGRTLLRRAYNYDDNGDQGLIFICFQRDPTQQFVPIQRRLDEQDLLNEWVTHIGSAVYFIPPGVGEGQPDRYWGQRALAKV